MPTITQVDCFILKRVGSAVQRPLMFASSPSGFEELLINMDLIRAFLNDKVDSSGYVVADKGYLNYLQSHGYGTATVTSRLRIDHGNSVSDDQILSTIVREWNQYMNSDYRV